MTITDTVPELPRYLVPLERFVIAVAWVGVFLLVVTVILLILDSAGWFDGD
jgi:hypothetical protein